MIKKLCLLIGQHLSQWNWPTYNVAEQEAVTEENPPHPRFVVGGSFKMEKLSLEAEGSAPVAPGQGSLSI